MSQSGDTSKKYQQYGVKQSYLQSEVSLQAYMRFLHPITNLQKNFWVCGA